MAANDNMILLPLQRHSVKHAAAEPGQGAAQGSLTLSPASSVSAAFLTASLFTCSTGSMSGSCQGSPCSRGALSNSSASPVATPSMVWPPTPSPCAPGAHVPSFLGCSPTRSSATNATPTECVGSEVVMMSTSASFQTSVSTSSQQMVLVAVPLHASLSSQGPTTVLAHQQDMPPVSPNSYPSSLTAYSAAGLTDDEDGSNQAMQSLPGSALHFSGKCNPCAWFWKSKGCQLGVACNFCHLCESGELNARKKVKVAAMRAGIVEPARPAGSGPRVRLSACAGY